MNETREHENGYCVVCGCHSSFRFDSTIITPQLQKAWGISDNVSEAFNRKESMFCSSCGSSLRIRRLATVLMQTFAETSGISEKSFVELLRNEEFRRLRIAEINACGALHSYLEDHPNLYYSEWLPGAKPGEVHDGVRYEDLQCLTYPDNYFDVILTSETLEHVPDPDRAWREIYRTLKVGGCHIFTIPILPWRRETIQRARFVGGTREDLLEPVYHSPWGREDVFVYTDFGTDVVEKLNEIGLNTEVFYLSPETDSDVAMVFRSHKNEVSVEAAAGGASPLLEWTGERYLPWLEEAAIGYEHLHRYAYATQLVRNKRVLDLACGEGYGSYLLARTAESVMGIDIDEHAIKRACNKYIKQNLAFKVGSITEVPIAGTHLFDVAVCFEALEHVQNHRQLLSEVKRLLTPDGVFIVSTPNKKVYTDEPGFNNPFHVHELYFEEFRELFGRYFKNVQFLGQRIYCNSNIWPVFSGRDGKVVEYVIDRNAKEFVFVENDKRIPLYFIAIASDADRDIEEPGSALIDVSDALLKQKDGQIAALNHLLEERDRIAQKALADKELEAERDRLKEELLGIDATIKSQETLIAVKEQEIVQRESEREWFKQDADRAKTLLRNIEGSLAWLLITEFRRVRDMSLPEGTLRRKTYNSVKTFLKNRLRSRAKGTLIITGGMEATSLLPYADGSVSAESARHQRAGGVVRIDEAPQDRLVLEAALKSSLNLFLSSSNSTIMFQQFQEPRVSIVIPTFNKAEYLYQCLASVFAHTEVPYEVIIVDDFSRDVTPLLLQKIKNIKWVRNPNNLGFLRTANRGASLARGRYVLFLNNDVVVTPQWLSALLRTMEAYPGCGAVGAKLVRTDGTLQEAGSIIWQDGSVSGYGRGDNPWKPEYCYVREVDYCSAACLLVRRDLFEKLRGFDERYVPSYYEDSDLCFALWQAGYKTVLQAQVAVLHHEFVSHSAVGAQHAMEVNQPKFAGKWKQEFSQQQPYGKTLLARDRRRGKRVLVLDDQVPAPRLGSGFPRAYKMLELLAELDCVVTFLPVGDPTAHQPTTGRLQELGIEVLCGEKLVCEDLLRIRSGHYDVVFISRPHNGSRFLSLVRKCFPTALIVYDAEAIFCFRQFLKAEIEGRPMNDNEKQAMLREELSVMSGANVVMTVSELEREAVLREKAHDNVVVWQHPQELCKTTTPFSERRDLLFVGGFLGGHPPNTDAVRYFVSSIFPKILLLIPDCRLFIVGSQPPESVKELASEHVVVTGFVERLEEYYGKCRVFVVPIRFMAGVSLKLIEAMSYGIPSVVSSVAASGLNLRDGREALIAADDEEFVNKVLRIYENETLWHAVQSAAQDYIRDHCSPAVMKDNLARILAPTLDVCFKQADEYGYIRD